MDVPSPHGPTSWGPGPGDVDDVGPGHGGVQGAPAEAAARALREDPLRVGAAHRLLTADGEQRRRLDVLAGQAAQLVGATSARIALLSEVHSRVGSAGPQPEDPGTPGAQRPAGELVDWLCTQTAASGQVLSIADTHLDERVSASWPVTDGGVGAYLGVPVVDVGGQVVGAVCVLQPDAHTWSAHDADVLAQVAAAAAAELELAALTQEHVGDRALLDLTVAAAELGTFDLDLASGELMLNDRLLQLSGLTRETFGGTADDVYARLHPDDREVTIAAVQDTVRHGGTYSAQYRILDPDGTIRWIAARGATLPAADLASGGALGAPARLLGAAYDVTTLREEATRTEQILDAMAVGYLSMDADWRITYVNAEAVRALSRPREELVGAVIWAAFPDTVGTDFEAGYRRAAATGRPVTFDAHYPEPLDAWYEVRATPEGAGVALYFLDVTARKQAQRAAEEAAARLALLAAVSTELTGTVDAEQAVASLARLVVPALGDWCLVTLLDDDAPASTPAIASTVHPLQLRRGLRDVGWWHHEEAARPLVAEYAAHRIAELGEGSFLLRSLRQGRPVVVDDSTAALVGVLSPRGRAQEAIRRLAPTSAAFLPLRGRGRTVGVLSLFASAQRSAWTEQELTTAGEVAVRAGLALDSARSYRQQRDLAAVLQRSLLTDPPQPDHGQIVVRYTPAAEAVQVGGDWYDAFVQPDGATVLVIGDVVGHDVQAAAAMSQVRTALRTLGAVDGPTPAEILTLTDQSMANLQIATTATALVARLEQADVDRGRGTTRLRWSSAGHPPAMVVHPSGAVEVLAAVSSDLLLGVLPDLPRNDHQSVLDRGATVLLYTDGLVERRDQSLQEGLERLEQVLTELAAQDSDLDSLVDGLLRRMLPARPEDDVAVIAVRLHRQDRPRPPEAGSNVVPPHVPDEPARAQAGAVGPRRARPARHLLDPGSRQAPPTG